MNIKSLLPNGDSNVDEGRTAPEKRLSILKLLFHPLAWLVVIPTLIAAIYLFFIAAPQYQTEAQIIVRSQVEDAPKISGFGQLIGAGAGLSSGQREAQGLIKYLRSAEAIRNLQKEKLDPVDIFQRPEADMLTRLWDEKPEIENIVEHYRDNVNMSLDPDSNITTITVRTYRPKDSVALAKKIITLGENRINLLNQRLIGKGLELANLELESAKQEFADNQKAMQNFRNATKEIDPAKRAQGEEKGLSAKQSALDKQRAILTDMERHLSPASPQVIAQRSRVNTLAATVGQSRGRLTGQPSGVSQNIGNFEELSLQQQLTAKRLEVARANYQRANSRAENDRLFVISVVNPFTPEEAIYPKPFRSLLTIFLGLLLAYGIFWLIIAGIREHRN